MKVTESVCEPAARTLPAAGVYRNVPGQFDEASNCRAFSADPNVIPAGVAQAIVGVALITVSATVAVAVL